MFSKWGIQIKQDLDKHLSYKPVFVADVCNDTKINLVLQRKLKCSIYFC